jgi:hypothetical protein
VFSSHQLQYERVSGSGDQAKIKSLRKVQEQMLKDGEPNIPFMMCWVNHPLPEKLGGAPNSNLLIGQQYGTVTQWEEHFLYLLEYFRHPNYIRNHGGQPIFIIRQADYIGYNLSGMMALWRKLAIKHGLSGLEIISPVGNFFTSDGQANDLVAQANLDGSFHLWYDHTLSKPSYPIVFFFSTMLVYCQSLYLICLSTTFNP